MKNYKKDISAVTRQFHMPFYIVLPVLLIPLHLDIVARPAAECRLAVCRALLIVVVIGTDDEWLA